MDMDKEKSYEEELYDSAYSLIDHCNSLEEAINGLMPDLEYEGFDNIGRAFHNKISEHIAFFKNNGLSFVDSEIAKPVNNYLLSIILDNISGISNYFQSSSKLKQLVFYYRFFPKLYDREVKRVGMMLNEYKEAYKSVLNFDFDKDIVSAIKFETNFEIACGIDVDDLVKNFISYNDELKQLNINKTIECFVSKETKADKKLIRKLKKF